MSRRPLVSRVCTRNPHTNPNLLAGPHPEVGVTTVISGNACRTGWCGKIGPLPDFAAPEPPGWDGIDGRETYCAAGVPNILGKSTSRDELQQLADITLCKWVLVWVETGGLGHQTLLAFALVRVRKSMPVIPFGGGVLPCSHFYVVNATERFGLYPLPRTQKSLGQAEVSGRIALCGRSVRSWWQLMERESVAGCFVWVHLGLQDSAEGTTLIRERPGVGR